MQRPIARPDRQARRARSPGPIARSIVRPFGCQPSARAVGEANSADPARLSALLGAARTPCTLTIRERGLCVKIVIPAETRAGEKRVAMMPSVVRNSPNSASM